ncbi:DUF1850 domain-containing protein [Halomonas daqiaonensis]|uniref:DUF1850 domain-containing protein n=1 Tax=Halomonas daqiaonensis TaxID=650850 RepID=A0A1H7L530_9GAMM|nr:DUF1850 domain-containing protein [Halomonas daqiaonensis]SEK94173.1 hypothetical protein SAMN04488129_105177 [Halomonas daqiaonensis]
MALGCLGLVTAVAALVLPSATLTLGWRHSVEGSWWEEDYQAVAGGVLITEARIESIGAGMEPPATAVRMGRWWHYHPGLGPLPAVHLANSDRVGGYTLCWAGRCRPLDAMVPRGQAVSIVATSCSAGGS